MYLGRQLPVPLHFRNQEKKLTNVTDKLSITLSTDFSTRAKNEGIYLFSQLVIFFNMNFIAKNEG